MDLGQKGEALAREYLRERGFHILETNWRFQRAEIDIIAMDGPILVFVEVKTRSNEAFGPPESFVTSQKEKLMVRAAAAYMEKTAHDWEIRFDVIAIIWRSDRDYRIEHLQDAFWPGMW